MRTSATASAESASTAQMAQRLWTTLAVSFDMTIWSLYRNECEWHARFVGHIARGRGEGRSGAELIDALRSGASGYLRIQILQCLQKRVGHIGATEARHGTGDSAGGQV